MKYRSYNWILLGTLLPAMLFIVMISFFTGPIDGDLTRIGGLSEREFGWNSTQPALEADYDFRIAHSLDEWNQHYDVVVLGDSFTLRPHTSWASFLSARTGWSIIMFNQNFIRPEAILESEAFKKHPPMLFIYESVERLVVRRLAAVDLEAGSDEIEPIPFAEPELRNLEPAVQNVTRNIEYASFRDRISDSMHIVKTRASEHLLRQQSQVVRMSLVEHECKPFTARNAKEMLIYRSAVDIRNDWSDAWPRAAAGYIRLAHAMESNRTTRFVTLIFPDKLSVYAHLTQDTQWRDTSVIPWLSKHRDMPRLDIKYRIELDKCTQDLYLPNNTHTGGTGSLFATEVLLEFLLSDTSEQAPPTPEIKEGTES